MCGISGTLGLDGQPADEQVLRAMVAQLRHRGPDECGVHTSGALGLGHARLNILDIACGQQPMKHPQRPLWITFNGEIFNYVELRAELEKHGHRFATRSDTEVILHLYEERGDECVRQLNGQWAFAIWDEPNQKLFLSRDRMGIRPLFYTTAGRAFLFASEIKALLAHPAVHAKLDVSALDQIFTFWCTLPPRTAFEGIHELPPGHSLTAANGEIKLQRHWRLEYGSAPEQERSEEDYAQELLALLRDATRIRLRADVPVGSYLSGGIDSTVTTALAQEIVGAQLKTFSVTFESAEYDESQFQNDAVRYLGTEQCSVRCTTDDIAREFPEVIRHTEKPILRTAPAPLYRLARLVHEQGYKVVLTGEGSDEILGGYDIFKEAKIRRFWAQFPDSKFRPLLLKRLYPYMDGLQKQAPAYLKAFFHVGSQDLASPFFSHLPRWELTARLKTMFSPDVTQQLGAARALAEMTSSLPPEFSRWHPFERAQYLEATALLPGYILSSQGDRVAMAHAVEGRFPFLDHRVVEFAAKLPPRLKMKVLNEKYLLKRAARGKIPTAILQRPKQPYRAPDAESFFTTEGAARQEYVSELLSPQRLAQDGLFDPPQVTKLVDKVRRGEAIGVKDNMALVGVLSTQIFVDQFMRKAHASR